MVAKESDFYRCYPEVSVKYEREPVHPQISLENGPDTIHFKYVHGATVDPVLVDWHSEDQIYHKQGAWPIPTEDGDRRLALLQNHARMCGVSGAFSVFEGKFPYRLAFWTTPVDNETSDLFYSVWWPRDEGDDSDVIPEQHRVRDEGASRCPVGRPGDLALPDLHREPGARTTGRASLRAAPEVGPPVLRDPAGRVLTGCYARDFVEDRGKLSWRGKGGRVPGVDVDDLRGRAVRDQSLLHGSRLDAVAPLRG